MKHIVYIVLIILSSCDNSTISPPASQTPESKKGADISKTYSRIAKRTFITGNGLGGGEINFYETNGYSRYSDCDICRSVTRKGTYECYESYVVLSDTFCSIAAGTDFTSSTSTDSISVDSIFKQIEEEECPLTIDTLYIWSINDTVYLNNVPQNGNGKDYDKSLLWKNHVPYRFK